MYDKIYLIDSENISDEWVDILDLSGSNDHITVFYTDKSSHINCSQVCKMMEKGIGRMQWIKCMEGNNALDFQLVTELGAMIERNEAAEYIIISKDNGFNVVVNYWNSRDIKIEKMNIRALKEGSSAKSSTDASKKAQHADASKLQTDNQADARTDIQADTQTNIQADSNIQTDTQTNAQTDAQTDIFDEPEFIRELLKSVDISDHSMLYTALVAFEGQGNGAQDYRRIRDYGKDMQERLKELYINDTKLRGISYLELLLSRNQYEKAEGAILYDILTDLTKKKKDKFHKSLIAKYGKELGSAYYRMIKPHYNIIKLL